MIDWDDVDNATCFELHNWVTGIGVYVQDKIARLRLGVYDVSREGTLLEVLEEIEGMIRNG